MNCVVYRGNIHSEKQIVLYHADNHFSVITKLTAFLNKSYVCTKCMVGYNNPNSHICTVSCVCKSNQLCVENDPKYCNQCNRMFKSELCLSKHISNRTCHYVKSCVECGKIYYTYRKHKCGFVTCKVCNKDVPKMHKCFIQTIKPNEVEHKTFIFYDFECMVVNNIHVPNLNVSHNAYVADVWRHP